MKDKHTPEKSGVTRREFLHDSAIMAAGVAASLSVARADSASGGRGNILNFNEKMEYRRCGKTGLMVSAVCMGGHWKRLNTVIPEAFGEGGWMQRGLVDEPEFKKNRHDVVSRCIDAGINYIDACVGSEVLAYSEALKGRRDKMFLGYSWYEKEMRFDGWRTTKKLLASLDEGLHEAGLDYVDLWRITCYEQGGRHSFNESEEIAGALEKAKKQGKARFTGVSSHDRDWLKMMIEQFPDQIEVVVTPYTAASKVVPEDSMFDSIKQNDVGVFGIKPFGSNSLFRGDSAIGNEYAEEDDRRARMAIRYILCNPLMTAPIPGLINAHQVDNVARAVAERRELDMNEKAELDRMVSEMYANLPDEYQWLRSWEYI
ncbi:MAG: aldo/keto reductase [Verrucomicrobia bacterium]|nr:aldo/keto reductase [Verrucomicrobiota bacterium]MCF7708684.1 aldo/keto reductase [Verrucomicrobiota bacterium]